MFIVSQFNVLCMSVSKLIICCGLRDKWNLLYLSPSACSSDYDVL